MKQSPKILYDMQFLNSKKEPNRLCPKVQITGLNGSDNCRHAGFNDTSKKWQAYRLVRYVKLCHRMQPKVMAEYH